MQEFFMDHGLWLLVGLLVIIGLVFLLSGKDKVGDVVPPQPVVEPPVVAPVEPASAPASIPVSSPVTAASDEQDDLLRLKGVGPKLRTLLIDLGVTRFAQIAAWTDTDLAAIDTRLGNFKGRPVRDQWIDQAKYLAAGDIAGFEAKYGKL